MTENKIVTTSNNKFAEGIMIFLGVDGDYLDGNNILWRIHDGKWIGKRSVYCLDFTCKWLEETIFEKIKSWWCGKDSDYQEIFYRIDN